MGRGSQKDFGKEAKDAYVKKKLGAQVKLNCDYAENLYLGIPDVKRVKTHHLEKEKETYKYHQNFDDLRKSFLRPHGENKEIPEKLDTAKLAKFISLFDKPDVAPTTFLYCLWPEYFVPYDKYTKKYIEKLEALGENFIIFLRPRRFGKSLFLSTLQYYYDENRLQILTHKLIE